MAYDKRPRGFALLILVLALLLPLQAPAGELAHGQGILWQVTAPNGRSGHFLGTFHTTDPRVLKLPAPVTKAFGAARTLALEIVLTPQEQQALAMAAMLTDGRSLDQIVGPDLYAQSAAAARAYGLPPPALRMLKPWGLMSLLAAPPEEFARKSRGVQALDFYLQRMAQQQGKPVVALETVAEQIGLFDSFPEADQVAMLASTLAQHDEIRSLYEGMIVDYLARDIASIHALTTELSGGIDPAVQARFVEQMIDRRNRVMVERAQPLLQQGGAFIAVGALHLPGKKGILRLLEQRGYRIARVY